MEHYGLQMKGVFIAESVPFLELFTTNDIGRFIYDESTDKYYFGTATDWVEVGLTKKCVKYSHIDFGFLSNQVNAKSIPFEDSFLKSKNISDALKEISSGGTAIKNKSINSNHLIDKCIKNNHIDFGYSTDQVNASHIPINSILTQSITNLETVIHELENNFIRCVRNKIESTVWEYDAVDKLYMAHVSIIPITSKTCVIQCFDKDSNMIFPNKVYIDSYYNRIYIYYTQPIELNIIIIG